MKDLPQEKIEALEHMIDAHGIHRVLLALEVISGDKAEHVRTNWQDKPLARCWDNVAKACRVAWSKVPDALR